MTAPLRLELSAVPDSVMPMRRAVRRFAADAGASSEVQHLVALAVSEACTNVVVHAYDCAEGGPIETEARVDGGELLVVVCDRGRGMRPRLDSPGAGLGLPIIAQACSHVDVAERRDGGVRLTMAFALP